MINFLDAISYKMQIKSSHWPCRLRHVVQGIEKSQGCMYNLPISHLTPASSPWWQLWFPQPLNRHSTMLFSCPVQSTLSIHIGPLPEPKCAPRGASTAGPQPGTCEQTTCKDILWLIDHLCTSNHCTYLCIKYIPEVITYSSPLIIVIHFYSSFTRSVTSNKPLCMYRELCQ